MVRAPVAVTDKKVVPSDMHAHRFSDEIAIAVAFQNKSAKTLWGVKGTLVFKDIFGDLIKTPASRSTAESVPDRRTCGTDRWINQFRAADVKLAQTPQDKLKVTWEPDTYLFSDGTSLKAPSSE